MSTEFVKSFQGVLVTQADFDALQQDLWCFGNALVEKIDDTHGRRIAPEDFDVTVTTASG